MAKDLAMPVKTDLRDEIARVIWDGGSDELFVCEGIADAILSIPRIKEALAFHESCQQCFAVNGEFVVTEDNFTGVGGVSANG